MSKFLTLVFVLGALGVIDASHAAEIETITTETSELSKYTFELNYAWWAIRTLLGIYVAILIYVDARKIPRLFLNSKPWWWAASAIILGPIWVVLAYWAIHHSTISNRIDPTTRNAPNNSLERPQDG